MRCPRRLRCVFRDNENQARNHRCAGQVIPERRLHLRRKGTLPVPPSWTMVGPGSIHLHPRAELTPTLQLANPGALRSGDPASQSIPRLHPGTITFAYILPTHWSNTSSYLLGLCFFLLFRVPRSLPSIMLRTFSHSSVEANLPYCQQGHLPKSQSCSETVPPPPFAYRIIKALGYVRLLVQHTLPAGRLTNHTCPCALCPTLTRHLLSRSQGTLRFPSPKSTGSGAGLPSPSPHHSHFLQNGYRSNDGNCTYPPGRGADNAGNV